MRAAVDEYGRYTLFNAGRGEFNADKTAANDRHATVGRQTLAQFQSILVRLQMQNIRVIGAGHLPRTRPRADGDQKFFVGNFFTAVQCRDAAGKINARDRSVFQQLDAFLRVPRFRFQKRLLGRNLPLGRVRQKHAGIQRVRFVGNDHDVARSPARAIGFGRRRAGRAAADDQDFSFSHMRNLPALRVDLVAFFVVEENRFGRAGFRRHFDRLGVVAVQVDQVGFILFVHLERARRNDDARSRPDAKVAVDDDFGDFKRLGFFRHIDASVANTMDSFKSPPVSYSYLSASIGSSFEAFCAG